MEVFAEPESWTVSQSLRQTIDETKASWARSATITLPAHVAPRPPEPGKLRIAFLMYRGNPRCGGQGVYTRHLTRELVNLGHSVEVFSGPPWPELDEGVGFTPVRGLDLYRDPDPFRIPARSEFTSLADVAEFAVMLSAGFGEPLAYSMRIEKMLKHRRSDFDIIHDNQCMGPGIAKLHREGWPLLETLHHPITVDRSIALDHADGPWKRFTTRRWFGFLRMQVRVVQQLPAVLTVSHNSRIDINAQMKVPLERLTVVPVGVDHTVFKPYADVVKKKGRLMVTSSSDVPMKGLVPLLEAIAKLRVERDVDLIVIGQPKAKGRVATTLERLGLNDIVTTISGRERRGAGPTLRRSRGRDRAEPLRGVLPARDRGDELRRARRRDDRRGAARSGGYERGDRAARRTERSRRPGRRDSTTPGRPRTARAVSARTGASA